jgi:hypothetical protein
MLIVRMAPPHRSRVKGFLVLLLFVNGCGSQGFELPLGGVSIDQISLYTYCPSELYGFQSQGMGSTLLTFAHWS